MKLLLNNARLLVAVACIVLGTMSYHHGYEPLGILLLVYGALFSVGRGRDTTIIIGELVKEKQDESA